jgi:hypothetical protein
MDRACDVITEVLHVACINSHQISVEGLIHEKLRLDPQDKFV